MTALLPELKTLFRHAQANRRKRFYFLLFVMVAVALVEAINLGLILPFVGLLLSREQTFNTFALGSANPMLTMALAFSFVTIVAGALRALQLHLSVRLAFDFGSDLSAQIYRHVLNQPYAAHLSRSSSEIVSGILGHVNQVISWVLQPMLTLFSSLVLFIAIVLGLIWIGKMYALLSVLAFVCVYGAIIFAFRKKLRKNSEIIDKAQTQLVQSLQEGIGSLRDIILTRTQKRFSDIFAAADRPLRAASSDSLFWGGIPRIFVETIGICIIVAVAYLLDGSIEDSTVMIQIIATITLGAQRALPALQQIYSSWTSIAGSESTLRTVNRLLGSSMENFEVHSNDTLQKIDFDHSAEVKELSFAYNSQRSILKNLNFKMVPGEKVVIFGSSGSGKSTLLDVFMGLLPPSNGTIEIDGVVLSSKSLQNWQSLIAHVPQSIFLLDASISNNIAFGISNESIEEARILECARLAGVSDFIQAARGGLESVCGERGIRLSGGQRQRIGIARALYRQPSILILDEATNSIEPQMEEMILQNIKKEFPRLTIIMVTHRQTNFSFFDRIYELSDGRLNEKQGLV